MELVVATIDARLDSPMSKKTRILIVDSNGTLQINK